MLLIRTYTVSLLAALLTRRPIRKSYNSSRRPGIKVSLYNSMYFRNFLKGKHLPNFPFASLENKSFVQGSLLLNESFYSSRIKFVPLRVDPY